MVSIIIPLKQDQGYLEPCLEACLSQYGNQVEVMVLPDEPLKNFPYQPPQVIQEATGPVSPARKRNRGAQLSQGEILAFIDDDTCAQPGWLEAALVHFNDPKVGAVGGPSITPNTDPYWAQVSGAAYESWIMSGGASLRYHPKSARDVRDFPSCNLLVRRSAFDDVGGFGTDFWPGEDTEFCLALHQKGFRIRYEPGALIEHHRRPSLKGHFIQLGNYGLHRGYFAKRYPETSLHWQYLVPSLFVLTGSTLAFLAVLGSVLCQWLLATLASLYLILVLVSLAGKPPKLILPSVGVIFLSHICYGISFMRGLLAKRLPEEVPSSDTKPGNLG